MIEAAETGLQDVANQTHQPSGTLRITVPAVLSQSRLVDRISSFATSFPHVNLSLDFSDARRELIADGFDIAIRMGWLEDSSFIARTLFDVERWLVASATYLATQPQPLTPESLDDWDWLELAPVRHRKPEFRKGRRRVVLSRREPRASTNDANALYRLARQGAGLAIVPDFLAATDVATGDLCRVLPDWTVPAVTIYAVWPSNAPRDGLVRRFVTFLVEGLKEMREKPS
jgi:DNA-binding transcriptional LysR family regulator